MADETVKPPKAEGNNGIVALRKRLVARAGEHFNAALHFGDEIADERTRRDELGALSALFQQCGFPDLALLAAEEAVEWGRALRTASRRQICGPALGVQGVSRIGPGLVERHPPVLSSN